MTTYSLVKPRSLTNTTAFSGDLTAKWLYVDNADDDQSEKLSLSQLDARYAGAVSITGGSITGITDLAIADGGTGASTAQAAINALTQVSGATNEYVLTKDTSTGDATWKAAAGGSSLPVVDETAIVYKTGSPAITATFDANSLTTARVYTFPDEAMTLAGRGANTFTGAQTVSVSSTTALKVEQSSNNTLVVDTTNVRVGIGVLPDRQFHIFNGVDAAIKVAWSNTGGKGGLSFFQGESYHGGIEGFGDANSPYFSAVMFSAASNNVGNLLFRTRTGGLFSIRAKISNSGNFGIGTESPSARLHVTIDDDITNAVTNVQILTHNSTGAPAAGFGAGLKFALESSTTADQDAARLVTLWNVATHASRSADLIAYASDYGGEREIWRGRASGTAPQFAVLGATPVARQAHIADPSGGGTQDAEARTAINSILAALESFGFLATS